MKIEDLGNGYSRLSADNGIIDIRTDKIYSEVIVKNEYIRYFKAA